MGSNEEEPVASFELQAAGGFSEIQYTSLPEVSSEARPAQLGSQADRVIALEDRPDELALTVTSEISRAGTSCDVAVEARTPSGIPQRGDSAPIDFWRLPLPVVTLSDDSDEDESDVKHEVETFTSAIAESEGQVHTTVATADFWRVPLPELPDIEDEI